MQKLIIDPGAQNSLAKGHPLVVLTLKDQFFANFSSTKSTKHLTYSGI